jgi:chemotaxis protein MotB
MQFTTSYHHKYMNFSVRFALLTICLISLLASSCVSAKKYNQSLLLKDVILSENVRLKEVEKDYFSIKDSLSSKRLDLIRKNILISDLEQKNESANRSLKDLVKRYDQILESNQKLIVASSEVKQLMQETILQQNDSLRIKTQAVSQKELELNALKLNLELREKKLTELQEMVSAKEKAISELKGKVSNALKGFSSTDLTVTERKGRLYVSMYKNLLFSTGSKEIDTKGKEAIQKLASVLVFQPDIEIVVEGHTDTVGTAEHNWDLSNARATSVVKLLSSFGINPKKLTASGRSFYHPILPNNSEENKSMNRRTEIILSPKLDELFQLTGSTE